MTVPNQIAEEREKTEQGAYHRIQRLNADGTFIDEWRHITPLSLTSYQNKIYASDKMSDLVILNEDSGEIEERIEKISIYIHQLAIDKHGDLYAASVYPEHAGEKRGKAGPSHRRWTRSL